MFCKIYDFDPKKPISLYLCSSPTVIEDEIFQMRQMERSFPPEEQIIIQPHPDKKLVMGEHPTIKLSQTESADNYFHCQSAWGVNTSAFFEYALINKNEKNKENINIIKTFNMSTFNSLHFKSLKPIFEKKLSFSEWMGVKEKLPSELAVDFIESFMLELKKVPNM